MPKTKNEAMKHAARCKKYGITPAEYWHIAKTQGYKCAICNEEKPLVIDHCHTSQKVRGLLCSGCNTGLGLLRDNADMLLKAAEYLHNNGDGFTESNQKLVPDPFYRSWEFQC